MFPGRDTCTTPCGLRLSSKTACINTNRGIADRLRGMMTRTVGVGSFRISGWRLSYSSRSANTVRQRDSNKRECQPTSSPSCKGLRCHCPPSKNTCSKSVLQASLGCAVNSSCSRKLPCHTACKGRAFRRRRFYTIRTKVLLRAQSIVRCCCQC